MESYLKRTKNYFYPEPEPEKSYYEKSSQYVKSYFYPQPQPEKSYYEKSSDYVKGYFKPAEPPKQSVMEKASNMIGYFKPAEPPKQSVMEKASSMIGYFKPAAKSNEEHQSSYYEKASNYAKNYFEPSSDHDNSKLQGAAVGTLRNASKYVVSTTGRSTNVLNIFDKSARSSLGNPKWWVRYDLPHASTNFNHVNINKAITGLKDPHIPISSAHMQSARYLGKVAEKANEAAPYIATAAIAIDTGRLAYSAYKDYEEGTTKNTAITASSIAGGYTGGFGGAWATASFGSLIAPGLGTLIGGIVGGVGGGILGNMKAKQLAEAYYEEPAEKSKS